MSVFVVDASVVVKWFVPEVYSEAAKRLLSEANDYFAPDLLFAETAGGTGFGVCDRINEKRCRLSACDR
jgi:predicted nucleic acid-binding protein